MFLKRFMLAATILGACLLPVNGVAGSARAESLHGVGFGHWDLPTDPHDNGAAKGGLFASSSHDPVYFFEATLTETDHDGPFRSGGIKGLLYDPHSHHPVYAVIGTWKGEHTGAKGFWTAEVFPLDGHEAVGKMAGHYGDPEPFHTGGHGEFKGKFVIED